MPPVPAKSKPLPVKQAEALKSLRQKGRDREALKRAARLAKAHPGDPFLLNVMGAALTSLGEPEKALPIFRKLAALAPNRADSHYNLGLTLQSAGEAEESLACFHRAVQLAPGTPRYSHRLGSVLSERGEWKPAAEALVRAAKAEPANVDYLAKAGHALFKAGDSHNAVACYRAAIRETPDDATLHKALAAVHKDRGEEEEMMAHFAEARRCDSDDPHILLAVAEYWQRKKDGPRAVAAYKLALENDPEMWLALTGLAFVYRQTKKTDEAIETFQASLALNPDQPSAQHLLSSLLGETTARAPDEYVANLFDEYAEGFDESLVDKLDYHMPAQLARMLSATLPVPEGYGTALDLGCGTGLVGQVLGEKCTALHGIDLSAKMLDKARDRGVYDRLEVMEIEEGIRAFGTGVDLYTCVDVLVYVGRLEPLFETFAAIAKTGAHFLFSTEHIDGDSYRLEPSGRYSHAYAYIERLCATHGFEIVRFQTGNLRMESSEMLVGGMYLLRL